VAAGANHACLFAVWFADALTIQMQGVPKLPRNPTEDIPVQFIQMIPYIVTIVVLAGFIGQSRAPKALDPVSKER
jgi:simple sugar transport system permease protein